MSAANDTPIDSGGSSDFFSPKNLETFEVTSMYDTNYTYVLWLLSNRGHRSDASSQVLVDVLKDGQV